MQTLAATLSLTGLSPAEIQEIQAEFRHYPKKAAVSVEALKIVQKHRGWVSDASLTAVADLLEIPPAQLEAVATFYNLIYRQPVGNTVIHICNSVSCWLMGGDRFRERLCQTLRVELGEMSADGKYTVLPIVCLGACDHAPVAMLGDELLLNVNENSVDWVLGR
jgi:NADH-quinone oxidoreductase subunit E